MFMMSAMDLFIFCDILSAMGPYSRHLEELLSFLVILHFVATPISACGVDKNYLNGGKFN